MTTRSRAALDIVSEGMLANRVKLPTGLELMPSMTIEGAFYLTSRTSCTCPDARIRKEICKHQLAIRLQDVLDDVEIPF